MKSEKGSVLIISLWILAILVVFALGLGHRAMINLQLARYQRDRLKAYNLAKAGINRAIVELESDQEKDQKNPPAYDSLTETWSTGRDPVTNKPLFENVELKEGSGETFTVRYLYDKEDDIYLCMADEERKININRMDDFGKQQLIQLFIFKEIFQNENEALDLANTIIDWIDEDKLKFLEELSAILEYFYQNKAEQEFQKKAQEVYNKIKDLTTVWGSGQVNINTASEDVLRILGLTAVAILAKSDINEEDVESLLGSICTLRDNKKYFTVTDINMEKIKENLELGDILTDDRTKIMGQLISRQALIAISETFKIEAVGNVYKLNRKITAIYNRAGQDKKIVYWHES